MSLTPYFAYGANMNATLLAQRLGRRDKASLRRRLGVLRDHALVFDKLSSTNARVGFANIARVPGDAVEGVLNLITRDDLARLDAIELAPVHYVRVSVEIYDPIANAFLDALAYRANAAMVREGLAPERRYLERMLGGADLLSSEYTRRISTISCIDDKFPA